MKSIEKKGEELKIVLLEYAWIPGNQSRKRTN